MPTAPLRYCGPHCNVLVPSGRCPAHTTRQGSDKGWQTAHGANATRIRGRKLQALRQALWVQEPQCRACHRFISLPEMIRDHIIPLAEGGTDTEDNCQPLCQACSDIKTHYESARGIRRNR